MEELVYYNNLYDLYGELLTDKQKKYFEDYYFHNYSYSEMAEEYGVSRNAAFNQVHAVLAKLEEYENKLQLFKKKKIIQDISLEVKNEELKKKLENLF